MRPGQAQFALLLAAAGLLGNSLQLDDGDHRAPPSACRSTHPIHLGSDKLAAMSGADIMHCYAAWHDATLASWAKEPGDCRQRKAVVVNADHGLGDSGGHFAGKFAVAIRLGFMILWDFADRSTVWQHAMVAPFKWSFREHMHLFCLDNQTYRGTAQSPQTLDADELPEPPTVLTGEALANEPTVAGKLSTVSSTWHFLYPPSLAVRRAIKHILDQVQPDETLVGVHFRSQWFGSHSSCGCKDPQSVACLVSQAPEKFAERAVKGFNSSTKVKFFVASDSLAGVKAFRGAFGDSVLSFPDEMPIEHAIDTSPAGAVRVLADFLLLSKSSALVTSCGSTFSWRVQDLSMLPNAAILTSGESECTLKQHLDVQGFRTNMVEEHSSCSCYAPTDETELPDHGGTCEFQCKRVKVLRPSKCSTNDVAPTREHRRNATAKRVLWHPQIPSGKSLSHRVEDFPWLG